MYDSIDISPYSIFLEAPKAEYSRVQVNKNDFGKYRRSKLDTFPPMDLILIQEKWAISGSSQQPLVKYYLLSNTNKTRIKSSYLRIMVRYFLLFILQFSVADSISNEGQGQ